MSQNVDEFYFPFNFTPNLLKFQWSLLLSSMCWSQVFCLISKHIWIIHVFFWGWFLAEFHGGMRTYFVWPLSLHICKGMISVPKPGLSFASAPWAWDAIGCALLLGGVIYKSQVDGVHRPLCASYRYVSILMVCLLDFPVADGGLLKSPTTLTYLFIFLWTSIWSCLIPLTPCC